MKLLRFNSGIRVSAVFILAGMAGFLLSSRLKPQVTQAPLGPFTAQIVEERFSSGTAKLPAMVQYITVARRDDGSEAKATSEVSPTQEPGTLRDIYDAASFKHIILEPFTRSSMTFYLSEGAFKDRLDWGHCPANLDGLNEHSTILGYDTVRYRTKEGSSTRYETNDGWIAPDLGCFVLERTFATSQGAWNQDNVVSITKGEPTSSMFDVPSGYVERTPIQLESVWAAQFGSEFMPMRSIVILEQNYERGRANH